MLCKKLAADGIARSDGSDLFVIFISNENKQACNQVILNHCLVHSRILCKYDHKITISLNHAHKIKMFYGSTSDSIVASEGEPQSRWGYFVGLPCYLHTGKNLTGLSMMMEQSS